ncbi:MAG: hypothetical protein CR982_02345 [Candidatus Cloacimonadota bacterium]|nr:MAG: hypothetical protein CR982_02345 [Candidatus Cloacimonadota bacterium]PIE81088.1 MAG: hypothetical protein CSA15_01045 [Candidatus Delongbacteria bacterium]
MLNKVISDKDLKKIKKILIIQYKPFGDVLINTAYFPILRKKFPNVKIDYLIQRPYKLLLEDNPYLDDLIIMEKKKGLDYYLERLRVVKDIRKRKYDLVIDQLRSSGSAQITLFSGAKHRIGWNLKKWNFVYNYRRERSNERYYALMKCELLQPLGINEESSDLYYNVKKNSQEKIDNWLKESGIKEKNFVVFSPGTPILAKQWSVDNFAKLGNMILENHNLDLIFLWGPKEDILCKEIISKMEKKPILAPPTTFNEAAAVLKRAKIYISQDGGINHLAISQKCPSIAIFGPHTNPKKWQAWHKKEYSYLKNYNHKDKNDRTLGVSSEEVYKKFKEMLEFI